MVRAGIRNESEKFLSQGLLTVKYESSNYCDFDRNSWMGFGTRPPKEDLATILKRMFIFPLLIYFLLS